MAPKEEDLAPRLQIRFSPYDAQAADEALEALAEFLVAVWLRRQEAVKGQQTPERSASQRDSVFETTTYPVISVQGGARYVV